MGRRVRCTRGSGWTVLGPHPSGSRYWTVIGDHLQVMPIADRYLRELRFGRSRAELTTKLYAGAVALYLRRCRRTGRDWSTPAADLFRPLLGSGKRPCSLSNGSPTSSKASQSCFTCQRIVSPWQVGVRVSSSQVSEWTSTAICAKDIDTLRHYTLRPWP